jgi:hypothetical protein
MKNPTEKKVARKSPRSKNAARVDRQLDEIKEAKNAAPKKGETVLHFDTVSGEHVKAAMVEAKKKSSPAAVKKAIKKLRETAPKQERHLQGSARSKPSKAVLSSQSPKPEAPATVEPTRGELGKVRRAYRRAATQEGFKGGSEADIEAFAYTLRNAGVAIMQLTSRRISKVLTGDLKIQELK